MLDETQVERGVERALVLRRGMCLRVRDLVHPEGTPPVHRPGASRSQCVVRTVYMRGTVERWLSAFNQTPGGVWVENNLWMMYPIQHEDLLLHPQRT